MSVSTLFRRAAGFVPSGVFLLQIQETWFTVSSLQPISFTPAWVSIAINGTARRRHIFAEGTSFTAILLQTGEDGHAKNGTEPPRPGLLELDCRVGPVHPVGDHDLILAEVEAVRFGSGQPLIYWRRAFHRIELAYPYLASRGSLDRFVQQWETGTLPKPQWTHGAHVTVGAYYAVLHGAAAFEKTREGILRFNIAVGTPNTEDAGYHETLTGLWARVLAEAVRGIEDPLEAARHAVERYGEDRDLHHLFYSFDVVRSREARRSWIAPDLRNIP